jgi:hypothetical protein
MLTIHFAYNWPQRTVEAVATNRWRPMATARKHRCDYIALEEAFFIPELAERQPMPHLGCLAQLPYRLKTESAERFQRGLPDFTEYWTLWSGASTW